MPRQNFIFSLFFDQGSFLIFGDSFIGRVAKHAIYVTGKNFSWNDFPRKLVVCIFFLRVWAGYSWIFLRFYGRFAFSGRIGIVRGKMFFPKIIKFLFGFWAKKIISEKQFGMLVKNCLLRIQSNIWSYFFWICT